MSTSAPWPVQTHTRRHVHNIFSQRYSFTQRHYYVNHSVTGSRMITNDSEDFPSCSPSHSKPATPTGRPSVTPTLSSEPSVSPTLFPSLSPVPSSSSSVVPTTLHSPSPQPSVKPTTFSSEPLSIPTGAPTPFPTLATQAPTPLNTPPSEPRPTQMPTLSIIQSSEQSLSPTDLSSVGPTSLTSTLFLVPFSSYELTLFLDLTRRRMLEGTNRFLALNQSVVDGLVKELDIVMTDYMVQELQVAFNASELVGVILTATAIEGNSTRRLRGRSVNTETDRYLIEEFQSASFHVNGSAIFSSDNYTNGSEANLSLDVDVAVDSLLDESNEDDMLMFMQTHPASNLLRHAVGLNDASNLQKAEGGNNGPGALSITFGVILIAVALVSLSCYTWICWKKHRNDERKGERDSATPSHSSSDSNQAPPTSITTPRITPDVGDVSSHPSNQNFFFEVSLSDDDPIGTELEMAASYDRQVWENTPDSHKKQAGPDEVRWKLRPPTERSSERKTPNTIRHFTLPGNKNTLRYRSSVPLIDTSREERATIYAPPTSRSNSGMDGGDDKIFLMGGHRDFACLSPLTPGDTNDGCCSSDWSEGSALLVASQENLATKASSSPQKKLPTAMRRTFASSPNSPKPFTEELPPDCGETPFYKSKNEGRHKRTKSKTDGITIAEYFNARSSERARPLRSSSDTPTKSSVSSVDTTMASMDIPKQEDDKSNDTESLLTAEILREVQLLSRFVKKYEKKNDKRKRKDHRKVHVNQMASKSSFQGAGYDKMDDKSGPPTRLQSKTGRKLESRSRRNQSTQTEVEADGQGYANEESEESSHSGSSSNSDSESVDTDVSMDSRIGIDPLKGKGFTAGYLIGQLDRPYLTDLKRLFGERKSETSVLPITPEKLDSGHSLSSLRRGKSVVDEVTANDSCQSQSPGEDMPTDATSVTPKQKNTSFRSLLSILEAETTEDASCSSESSNNIDRIGICAREIGLS